MEKLQKKVESNNMKLFYMQCKRETMKVTIFMTLSANGMIARK